MTNGNPPPVGLSAQLANVIVELCGVLRAYGARDWTAAAFIVQIQRLLHRRLDRFIALVERFHAGTLPKAGPPQAAPVEPSERPVLERLWDPMPRNRAWLWHLVVGVPAYLSMFEDLLADPEMAALLAADPQAGRLLRPLWFMVSPHPLPALLQAPRRRRSPSPSGGPAPGCATPRALPRLPRQTVVTTGDPPASAAGPVDASKAGPFPA